MGQSHYRAELYLRTDTIGTYGPQRRTLDRVRDLAEGGVFDEAELEATWEGVETVADDTREGALETYAEFREWAAANDLSLEPAFDRRQRYVEGTTEIDEAVIFPTVALALHVDDTLRAVLPCTDEFAHFTVHEALEGFERGDIDRWLARFRGIRVDRTEPYLDPSSDLQVA
jgi:hypothetical protein